MMNDRGGVAFIDHSFHKHSKSSDFFLAELERWGPVTRFWDNTWRLGKPVSHDAVSSAKPGRAVFWQAYPNLEFLKEFKGPVVVVPMYDDPASGEQLRMMSFYRVTAVCFSQAVEDIYRQAGIDVIAIRYAPEPAAYLDSTGPPNVFYWDRGAIPWSDVKELIGDQPLGKVFVKQSPDPGLGRSVISAEDRDRFDLEIITGWMGRDEYEAMLKRCQVYIAPRLAEGIGLSFLEAMSHGLAVLGVNRPTMNEYIKDGVNGFLFDLPAKNRIDLSNAREVGRRAHEEIARLRKDYESRLSQVVGEILDLSYRPSKPLDSVRFVGTGLYVKARRAAGHVWRSNRNRFFRLILRYKSDLPLFLTAYSFSPKTAIGVQNRQFVEAFDNWLLVYWQDAGGGLKDVRAISIAGPFHQWVAGLPAEHLLSRLFRKTGLSWWRINHQLRPNRQDWFVKQFRNRVTHVYVAPLDAAEAIRSRHLIGLLERPYLLHIWDSLNGPLEDDENFVWLIQNAAKIMVISENAARDVRRLGRDAEILGFMRAHSVHRAQPPENNRLRVVTLGYLGEYAIGLRKLDEAVDVLRSEGVEIELLYIGSSKAISEANVGLNNPWTSTGFVSNETRDEMLASGHVGFMLGPLDPPDLDHRSRYSIPSRCLDFLTTGLPLIGTIHSQSATGEFLLKLGLPHAVSKDADEIVDYLRRILVGAAWQAESDRSLAAFELILEDSPHKRLRRAMDEIAPQK